jgi:hypothetical protein
MAKDIIKDTDEDFLGEDADLEALSLKGPIISYGADYTLDSIRQYVNDSKQIIVQPSFQRKFVWDIKKSSKLIESFILGYPVPNILLGRDPETEVMEVIDGQQRILSVCDFFKGRFRDERIFKLTGDDLDKKYVDKTFDMLDEASQKRLKNSILKAVVLVYPKGDPNIKFTAFQRINTGSVVLNQQEIRNCIFGGPLNEMLFSLNIEDKNWRKLLTRKPDKRMRDVETLLRFFAAYFNHKGYEKPVTAFLNKFMENNRNISEAECREWKKLFSDTLAIVVKHIGADIFPRSSSSKAFNRAIFESVMAAVARLRKEEKLNSKILKKRYMALLKDKKYTDAVLSQTSDKKKYLERINLAYKELL